MSTRNATIWMMAVVVLVLCGQVRAELVAHWQFDEGQGGTAYDSVGSNHGTIHGAQWTGGRIGDWALDFDGTNDCVDATDFMLGEKFTVAMWVNPSSTADGQCFIGKHTSGGGNIFVIGFWYSGYHGRIRSDTYTSPTKTVGWQHIAVVVEKASSSTSNLTFYKDGNILWSEVLNDVAGDMSGKGWTIGQEWDGSSRSDFFNGIIDDVRIYNGALSTEEIQQIYQEGFSTYEFAVIETEDAIAQKEEMLEAIDEALEKEWAACDALEQLLKSKDYEGLEKGDIVKARQKIHSAIQHEQQSTNALEKSIKKLEDALTALGWDPNLVSHWQFDEGEGDIAYDSVGSNNGTIYGAQWMTGQVGGALEFDGVNDCVDIGSPASLMNMGSATVAMWFKPNFTINDTLGRWFVLFGKNVSGAGAKGDTFLGFCPTSAGRGRLNLDIITNTGPQFIVDSDSDFWPAGDWQHVAVSWDNITGAMRMFINGVEQADKIDDFTGLAMGADRDVIIGSSSEKTKYWWDGAIDEVTIWNRALSAEEIQELYEDGLN